ncbi:MAG: SusC/RagA family TonB-linked outer membrane protein [Bacteroidales bacterium]|nr:SusC/RagA family TonB-linked outer membrane protein [Bacteroidales bacterium]MCF8390443.1 SusC/RagA family TonB-linked outer membrane protein [Bacteroidales bacterium]
MKRIYLILPLLIFLFSQNILAQERRQTIQGLVLDDEKQPLIGVSVIIAGTTTGAITDVKGNFAINANPDDQLTFTYVGFTSQTVSVGNQTYLSIVLQPDVLELEDVVVVGYGSQKKESVVGAIVQTSGDDIKRSTVGSSNLTNSLSGLLPGVVTLQRSGKPGEFNTEILIRAQNTWNSSSPLVLVDGVERELSEVNPNEIDKISVLKDASATAVFGVKGGNGVILVTTKRGKVGKPQLSFEAESTFGFLSRLPEIADSYDGITNRNYAIINELPVNNKWGNYVPDQILEYYRTGQYPQFYQDYDWQDRMLKDFAKSHRFNMDASGGTKFVKYFTSIGYQYEGSLANSEDVGQGYVPDFNYQRFNFRTNLDFNLTNTTVFSVQLGGYLGVQKQPPGSQDIYIGFFEKPGDDPIFQYDDGVYGAAIPSGNYMTTHPFVEMNFKGQNVDKRSQLNNDFILSQDLDMLTKGLSFRAKLSYDNSFYSSGPDINDDEVLTKNVDPAFLDAGPDADIQDYTTYIYPNTYRPEQNFDFYESAVTQSTENVSGSDKDNIRRQIYYQFSLDYGRTFGDHSLGALALMSRQETTRGSDFTRYREDWVGRFTYDYKKIYLFEANGAYNGSEKFAGKTQVENGTANKSYRFGFFPSMAAGLMISNMDFFKNNVPFMNTLKLRYSNGRVGVDEAPPPWQYISDWNLLDHTSEFGSPSGEVNSIYPWRREGLIANPDLHWEEVQKQNIAIEAGILNNLVSFTADYFWDHRYDIFMEADDRIIPFYYGATQPPSGNLGETKSQGYEIEVKLSKQFESGVHLFGGISYTHVTDEVLKREEPELLPDYRKDVGYAIGQPRPINNTGVIQNWDDLYTGVLNYDDAYLRNTLPGDFRHLDYNADGIIDNNDGTPYGYPQRPQNTYSFRLGAKYKGLEAFVFFYGVFNITRNEGLYDLINESSLVYLERLNEAYSPELGVLDQATYHQLRYDWSKNTFGQYQGNGSYMDGAYTRLKNAEIAYSLSQKATQKMNVAGWRFFINGSNLLFWSKQRQDQEVGRFERQTFPLGGSFQLGTRITF